MPGAKMGLVDYICPNPFSKAKKISSYDERSVIATLYKILNSFKHLIEDKPQTLHN